MVNSVRFRLAACPGRESGSIGGNYRDALHVIVPADVTPSNASMVVTSTGKVSNTTTLAIR